jgi:hypothetical protein
MWHPMMTKNVVAHAVTMVNQAVVHVLRVQKANQVQLRQVPHRPPSVFALKSRMAPLTLLCRLRKQENNHAATSTQKVS